MRRIWAQNTYSVSPTSSPPIGQNHERRVCSPTPGSNDEGAAAVPWWRRVKHEPSWTMAALWANDAWSSRVAPPPWSRNASWNSHRYRSPPSG